MYLKGKPTIQARKISKGHGICDRAAHANKQQNEHEIYKEIMIRHLQA